MRPFFGTQDFALLGVTDTFSDLPLPELVCVLVCLPIAVEVVEGLQPEVETTTSPELLPQLLTILARDRHGITLIKVVVEATKGLLALLKDLGVDVFEGLLCAGFELLLSHGKSKVRSADEDRETVYDGADLLADLDTRSTGADDSHLLASAVDGLVPLASVNDLTLELLHAWDLGDVDLGSEAEAEDNVLSCDLACLLLTWASGDGPQLGTVVPVRAADTVVEAAVLAEIELVIEVVEVLAELFVVGIFAREVPRLPNLGEGEAVEGYLAVDPCARVLLRRKEIL